MPGAHHVPATDARLPTLPLRGERAELREVLAHAGLGAVRRGLVPGRLAERVGHVRPLLPEPLRDRNGQVQELASQIKTHTLTHLDRYLEQFEAAAKANGVHVHWAEDGAAHNRIVLDNLQWLLDAGADKSFKAQAKNAKKNGTPFFVAPGTFTPVGAQD